MFPLKRMIFLKRLILRRTDLDCLVMLIQEFQDEIGQVLVNLDPLVEIVDVQPHRTSKILFQGKQVEGLGPAKKLRASAAE